MNESMWLFALLAVCVIGALIALFLVRDLKLKKDVGRLLGELERLARETHAQQIRSVRDSQESISGALGREAGRIDTTLRETLQHNLDALAKTHQAQLRATEEGSSALATRLTESQRTTRHRISDEIHASVSAAEQRIIEQVQASQSELRASIQTRLADELAVMTRQLLHKMGAERQAAVDEVFDALDELGKRDIRFARFHPERERQLIELQGIQFDGASHQLPREQARILRSYLVQILTIADSALARKWLGSIAISGPGDGHGTYLFNLSLSLQRSQRILSILLSPTEVGELALNNKEIEIVQRLFAVNHHPAASRKAGAGRPGPIELHFNFRAELTPGPAPQTPGAGTP